MNIEVGSVTMVVENMSAMLRFYNAVFGAEFQPSAILAGQQTYLGKIAGIKTIFCPNAVVGIDAKRNRHQFDYLVPDVRAVMATALANGGSMLQEAQESNGKLLGAVYDPDQNSMVFLQNA
jgi:predicted enzyme related to lactoylglutathione lyase